MPSPSFKANSAPPRSPRSGFKARSPPRSPGPHVVINRLKEENATLKEEIARLKAMLDEALSID